MVCITILTSFSFMVVSGEKTSSNTVTVNYSFERPIIEYGDIDNQVYDRVIMQDFSACGNPGEPCLPARSAYILIPYGAKVNRISGIPGKIEYLGAGVNIAPVGVSVSSFNINLSHNLVANEVIYSSSDPFPGKLFTKIGTYSFRGYDILVLKLHPVQYVPITGELFYYTDMEISIGHPIN